MRVTVGLALLLSLPLGCGGENDGDPGGSATSLTGPPGTGDASTGPGDGGGGGSTGSLSATDGGDTSGGHATFGETGASTDVPAVCIPYCETRASCDAVPDPDACESACSSAWDNFEMLSGDQCLSDFGLLLGCLSGLSCADLAVYDEKQGQTNETSYPCRNEDIAVLISCQ